MWNHHRSLYTFIIDIYPHIAHKKVNGLTYLRSECVHAEIREEVNISQLLHDQLFVHQTKVRYMLSILKIFRSNLTLNLAGKLFTFEWKKKWWDRGIKIIKMIRASLHKACGRILITTQKIISYLRAESWPRYRHFSLLQKLCTLWSLWSGRFNRLAKRNRYWSPFSCIVNAAISGRMVWSRRRVTGHYRTLIRR